MQINPYLNFNGDCEAAFKFYQECLDGKIEFRMTHGESPMAKFVGPEWQDKIMHISLRVGDVLLMGSDAPSEHFRKPQGFSVSIQVKDVAEAERIFHHLSQGGEVKMPIQETFWAQRFGMMVDRFGTPWMINCPKPM